MNLQETIQQFQIQGTIREIHPLGNGHIHDTYHAQNQQTDQTDYVLQRINHEVFKAIPAMMHNIQAVTRHLQSQYDAQVEPRFQTLHLIQTQSRQLYLKDENDQYWRCFQFLSGLRSHDGIPDCEQIHEGAHAFGGFLADLNEFPVSKLHETIPDFHNVLRRLRSFEMIIKENPMNRLDLVMKEQQYLLEIADEMCQIQLSGAKGSIPLRVTHNDTKFNNVLLDEQGKGRCVIDLDTVMPGFVHYDFGDGVRTTICEAAEDTIELDHIQVDLLRFEAFASGYLTACGHLLSQAEKHWLTLSGAMMAYIMAVRFLTDYLAGDIYYKIHYEDQNLHRARAQLTLCREILARQPDLKKRL